jgi:hypothetical protein
MPTGDKDGDKMPNKWFSNRGQMIQAACAIIAVAIGIFTQRSSLTTSLDIEMVSKILFFPAAAVSLFQLGKYVQRLSTPSASPFPDDLPFDYRYLTPTIKVGSYHDLDRKLDTRRISVISIKKKTCCLRRSPEQKLRWSVRARIFLVETRQQRSKIAASFCLHMREV